MHFYLRQMFPRISDAKMSLLVHESDIIIDKWFKGLLVESEKITLSVPEGQYWGLLKDFFQCFIFGYQRLQFFNFLALDCMLLLGGTQLSLFYPFIAGSFIFKFLRHHLCLYLWFAAVAFLIEGFCQFLQMVILVFWVRANAVISGGLAVYSGSFGMPGVKTRAGEVVVSVCGFPVY